MSKVHELENSSCGSWTNLVNRIKAGDSSAQKECYGTFERGIRYLLFRYLNSRDIEYQVQSVLESVVEAIKCDRLREPEYLPSVVRTILQRTTGRAVGKATRFRRFHLGIEPTRTRLRKRQTPEEHLRDKQPGALMREMLAVMSARDREALNRFFLWRQDPQQICAEIDLTPRQFQLLKSATKQRFEQARPRKPGED
jgi:hypothetical protein